MYEAAYPEEVSEEGLSEEDVEQQKAMHSHEGEPEHAHEDGAEHEAEEDHGHPH